MLLRSKVVLESVVGRWYANIIFFILFLFNFNFILFYSIIIGVIVTDVNVTKVRCYWPIFYLLYYIIICMAKFY